MMACGSTRWAPHPISKIGFGGWGIGGATNGAFSYGQSDESNSDATIRAAIECGINFFDTAPAYGNGKSEIRLGKALGEMRNDVTIATKVGLENFERALDFSPSHIEASVHASLERLRSDYVDVVQLHSPTVDDRHTLELAFKSLDSLRRQGIASAIGVSPKSPADGLTLIELGFPINMMQVNLNLMDQRSIDIGLLDACLARGIDVFVRTPLNFGFLAGNLSPQTVFPPSDHRNRWSRSQISRWAHCAETLLALNQDRPHIPDAVFALRFCLSVAGVSSVLVGCMSPDEVVENASAASLGPLDPETLNKIRTTYSILKSSLRPDAPFVEPTRR